VVATSEDIVGVLLAAGRGARFGPVEGAKLLAPWPPGAPGAVALAVAAARRLRAVLPVVAVVRSGANGRALGALLEAEGCRVLSWSSADSAAGDGANGGGRRGEDGGANSAASSGAPDGVGAVEGTGASIACAVRATPWARGWIVALADMPAIEPDTVQAVRAALLAGAESAAPFHRGRRGHPVGFGAACRAELAALDGDEGARAVLARHPPARLEVDDPGILFDVDTPADLAGGAGPTGAG
jgi:molybdenum cofactor cytidylyltransferase